MRIAIVGSRPPKSTSPDVHTRWLVLLSLVRAYVRALPRDTIVVTGGAPGVDFSAEAAAYARGLVAEVYPADWDKHGRAAGPIRNRVMVRTVDAVTAFWDGVSPGTRDAIDAAREHDKPLIVYTHEGVHPATTSTMRVFPDLWTHPRTHVPVVTAPPDGTMCASCDRGIGHGQRGLWVAHDGGPDAPAWLCMHRECWLSMLHV